MKRQMYKKNKSLKIYLLLIIYFFIGTSCLDETEPPITVGIISGTIYNSQTMETLQGVTITTDPATSSVITKADGSYEILDVPEETSILTASHPSYVAKTTTVSVIADRSVTVDLQLTPLGPELTVSEDALNFGTMTENLTFHIQNTGIGTMNWSLTKNQNWLTVAPTSGTTTTETDIVNVSVNRSGYSPGNYTDVISLSSDANAKSISVIMTVADTTGPQLSVSPASYDFGSEQTEKVFEITNSGIGTLEWNASTSDNWISIGTTTGTIESETGFTTITINRANLSVGNYNGTISFTSNGGNQSVNVTISVPNEPVLSVSPTSLDFGSTTNTMSFDVSNSGVNNLTWTVSDNQDWITTNPNSGTNHGTVNVTVSRDGFSSGDYSGIVTVSSNAGSHSVGINMNVPADEPPGSIVLNDPTVVTTSSIELTWEMSTDGDFSSYNLYRDTNSSVSESSTPVTQIVNRYTVEYLDEGLNDGTTYYYRIYVEDEVGQTTGSNTVTASTTNAPGIWGVFATVTVDLFGVSALNDNFAYVVGDSGKIYKWDGSSVSEQDSPTTERLGGVAVIASNDIWISGERGIWHNTNGFWVQETGYPTSPCYDMDFVSSDSIWVAGDSKIYFYNGTGWTTISIGTGVVNDINMNSANSGWAITINAEIYNFNGISWNLLFDERGRGRAIWGTNPSNIWIGGGDLIYGEYYEIAHWDGVNWSGYNSYDIYDIDGLNENDIWFVGRSSVLGHWNGTELTTVLNPSPASPQINMITFISSNSGWGVCDAGVILRYSN